jgi:hypothetical protein
VPLPATSAVRAALGYAARAASGNAVLAPLGCVGAATAVYAVTSFGYSRIIQLDPPAFSDDFM